MREKYHCVEKFLNLIKKSTGTCLNQRIFIIHTIYILVWIETIDRDKCQWKNHKGVWGGYGV